MFSFINTLLNAAILGALWELREAIMANQAEHAEALRALTAQNEKVAAEQLAALATLQAALDAAGGTTPEVDEAMTGLRASIQRVDDLNPDAPPVEPAPV